MKFIVLTFMVLAFAVEAHTLTFVNLQSNYFDLHDGYVFPPGTTVIPLETGFDGWVGAANYGCDVISALSDAGYSIDTNSDWVAYNTYSFSGFHRYYPEVQSFHSTSVGWESYLLLTLGILCGYVLFLFWR